MAAHSEGHRAIPPVAFDQPLTGWPQWLREMAQSINLVSSWVGTATTPGSGGGAGTVTSVTAGTGLTASPNPIVASGTVSLAAIAAARLLGNPTGGAAAPSEISLGTGLSFAGSVLNVTAGGSGTVTSISAGTGITLTPGPITATGSVALTVPVSIANGGTGAITAAAGPFVQKIGDIMTGALYAPAISTASVAGEGSISLTYGGTTTTGFISWFLPDGTRQGYMGYTAAALSINIEQGGRLDLNGGDLYMRGTRFLANDAPGTGNNVVVDNAGGLSLILSSTSNQYRNTGHYWQNRAGSNYLVHDSANLAMYVGTALKYGGGPWADLSDIRSKRNVENYTSSLAELVRLRPVTYQRSGFDGVPDDGRTFIGLVADEAKDVMPELVGTMMVNRNGPSPTAKRDMVEALTLDATGVTWALVNAVRELHQRLEALEARSG